MRPAPSKTSPAAAPTVAPLTCLPTSRGSAATWRRALAVKVENTPEARPQAGLDAADIVYEEVVEGGITRFVSIFQSLDAPTLGPVRSARPEDPDILRQYHALFAFSGAATYVIALVSRTKQIYPLWTDHYSAAYHRVAYRRAPHNLYSSTTALWSAAGSLAHGPPSPMFACSARPPSLPTAAPTGAPATVSAGTAVTIDFSGPDYRAAWQWDAQRGEYLRSEAGRPHVMASGNRIGARNVLLFFVNEHSASALDARYDTTPIPTLTGSGAAVLYRDGVRITGTWSRPSLDDITKFSVVGGGVMTFAPGNTWIELVPVGTAVTNGIAR